MELPFVKDRYQRAPGCPPLPSWQLGCDISSTKEKGKKCPSLVHSTLFIGVGTSSKINKHYSSCSKVKVFNIAAARKSCHGEHVSAAIYFICKGLAAHSSSKSCQIATVLPHSTFLPCDMTPSGADSENRSSPASIRPATHVT